MANIFDFEAINRKAREAREEGDLEIEKRDGLLRGKRYRFSTPVIASGMVSGEGWIKNKDDKLVDFRFSKGKYAGVRDKVHIFEGTPLPNPVNETRVLFFKVEMTGGSKIIPEEE